MTSQQPYICKACASRDINTFGSEITLHFKGLVGLQKPVVFVFPEVVVCLTCGHSEFTMPETELRVLSTNTPVENAATLLSLNGRSDKQVQPRTEIKPISTTTDETITPKNRAKRRR
jgi:hypothetical protein